MVSSPVIRKSLLQGKGFWTVRTLEHRLFLTDRMYVSIMRRHHVFLIHHHEVPLHVYPLSGGGVVKKLVVSPQGEHSTKGQVTDATCNPFRRCFVDMLRHRLYLMVIEVIAEAE